MVDMIPCFWFHNSWPQTSKDWSKRELFGSEAPGIFTNFFYSLSDSEIWSEYLQTGKPIDIDIYFYV